MKDFLKKGHILYMDRYYSSPALYDDLALIYTGAVGTCMPNRRDLPKAYLGKTMKKGQVISCRRKHLLALKWKDKREVLVLSTVHTNKMVPVKVRCRGGHKDKLKPAAIDDYNTNMCGVDRSVLVLLFLLCVKLELL